MRGDLEARRDAVHPIADGAAQRHPVVPARRAERSRIGVIYNPRAAGNAGRAPLRAIDVPCAVPTTPGELEAALADFARREVGTVAVSGGDGTVRDVLTALPRAYRGQPDPAIAVLPAGRTDLIAGDVGARPRDDELAHLLAATKDGTLRRTLRPILRVDRVIDEAGKLRTVRGMLIGAAAFAFATEKGRREHLPGTRNGKAVILTMADVFRRLLFQGDPDRLLAGVPMALRADGRPDVGGLGAHRALLLVSSLRERIVLGTTPFWGEVADDQLQYLDVVGPARGVPRALTSLAVRRPWLAGPGWRSGAARTLDLRVRGKLAIDGELYTSPPSGLVRISADAPMVFVAP